MPTTDRVNKCVNKTFTLRFYGSIGAPRPEINDYIFYKITCDDCPDYIYIGSTGCFNKRKNQHKSNCNNPNSKKYNVKLYQTFRENGVWEKWDMIIIDEAKQ